jgi:nucleotide-binding universal stress UspA family protein
LNPETLNGYFYFYGGKMKIPRIKKILYATDLSQNARYAFGYAVSLANQYKAGITILHVLEELSPTALLMVGDIIGEKRWSALKTEKEDTVLDSIKSRLEAFCDEFSTELPDCPFVIEKTIVESGQPVDQIIQHAEEYNYDLVVMGSRGLGMLANVMMGSTSRRVLRRCRKPVLVVRFPEEVEK